MGYDFAWLNKKLNWQIEKAKIPNAILFSLYGQNTSGAQHLESDSPQRKSCRLSTVCGNKGDDKCADFLTKGFI
jgi:hypothetical protein